MTLVNIDPHVILHQKMHVPFTGIFVGRSIGLPAPCGHPVDTLYSLFELNNKGGY